MVAHRGDDRVAYQVTKDVTPACRSSVPVVVEVDPPAVVRFHRGPAAPADAVGINEGWVYEE